MDDFFSDTNPTAPILLADDDPEDRIIIQSIFADLGRADWLHFVTSGEAAICYLSSLTLAKKLPNLIVLDMKMPLMSGTETLRTIKSMTNFKHIPVVIYSTSMHKPEARECEKLGAIAYIVKPSSYADCLKTAHYFCGFCE